MMQSGFPLVQSKMLGTWKIALQLVVATPVLRLHPDLGQVAGRYSDSKCALGTLVANFLDTLVTVWEAEEDKPTVG